MKFQELKKFFSLELIFFGVKHWEFGIFEILTLFTTVVLPFHFFFKNIKISDPGPGTGTGHEPGTGPGNGTGNGTGTAKSPGKSPVQSPGHVPGHFLRPVVSRSCPGTVPVLSRTGTGQVPARSRSVCQERKNYCKNHLKIYSK